VVRALVAPHLRRVTEQTHPYVDQAPDQATGDLLKFVRTRFGEPTAVLIQRAFGGGRVYVALDPDDQNPLASVIGLENARLLAARFGDQLVDIPRVKQTRAMLLEQACLSGRTAKEIAEEFGITERAVQKAKKRIRERGLTSASHPSAKGDAGAPAATARRRAWVSAFIPSESRGGRPNTLFLVSDGHCASGLMSDIDPIDMASVSAAIKAQLVGGPIIIDFAEEVEGYPGPAGVLTGFTCDDAIPAAHVEWRPVMDIFLKVWSGRGKWPRLVSELCDVGVKLTVAHPVRSEVGL